MNNTPKVVRRDGIRDKDKEIGTESSHTHKMLCGLRHAGATWRDLVAMRDADPSIFSEFLARLRGIPAANSRGRAVSIINLDYEPGTFESLTALSNRRLVDGRKVLQPNVSDDHLGIWPVCEDFGSFVFGDKKFVVEKPTGGVCAWFTDEIVSWSPGRLTGISKDHKHLNLAMATWLSQEGRIDIPFNDHAFDADTWKNATIFFLGTVWLLPDNQTYLAPALTSDKSGRIKYEIKPVPVGQWRGDCYVARLIPR